MTSAPKKKRDFFNGSQGLNFRDFRTPDPQVTPEDTMPPDTIYDLNGRRPSVPEPPMMPVIFPHHEDTRHPSPGYSFPVTFPNRQIPCGYYGSSGQDQCMAIPPVRPIPFRCVEDDDSSLHHEVPAPCPLTAPDPAPEQSAWGEVPEVTCLEEEKGSNEGTKKKKKRKQTCSMCANHGIYKEIRGHKWFCPYRDAKHKCSKCEITRNRQYFMAKQQKLTREKQQYQQSGHQTCVEPHRQPQEPEAVASPKDVGFPRMKELIDETENILEWDVINQICEILPPKVTHH